MLASIFGGDQQYSQECHSKMGMSLLVKSQLLLEQSQLFIEILIIVSIFIILGAFKYLSSMRLPALRLENWLSGHKTT